MGVSRPQPLRSQLSHPGNQILERQAGEFLLRAAAHPSLGASRPGTVLGEVPGGPWAGPARGRGSWGLGKAGTPCSWMTRGRVFTARGFLLLPATLSREPAWREALDGLLEGGHALLPHGLCASPTPLPWETGVRGPSPTYSWAGKGFALTSGAEVAPLQASGCPTSLEGK